MILAEAFILQLVISIVLQWSNSELAEVRDGHELAHKIKFVMNFIQFTVHKVKSVAGQPA